MEELAGFIPVIIIAVISAIAKANQKKEKAKQTHFPPVTAPSTPVQAAPVKPAHMASMPSAQQEGSSQPAQITVHPHLEPGCDTHDAPSMGSLAFTSTEGKDPCHEDQFENRRTEASSAARPGLTLDWSGDAMVKAFVMQEVLTRPAQRRAR